MKPPRRKNKEPPGYLPFPVALRRGDVERAEERTDGAGITIDCFLIMLLAVNSLSEWKRNCFDHIPVYVH